ncbi:hypothetical protein [Flammeovirga agarivorans]|uniref:Uncharacterized protein n=1 Tax=Flammeovirga agarivorans TaxID=2726742 RepID=A0A7X8SIF3_9BACT|nr:hypothetical protein [Flammeovirga agarivorans]NLR90683.1 hypothetical protein [Flammeovirga agarivorans]
MKNCWKYALMLGATLAFYSCDEDENGDVVNPEETTSIYFATDGDVSKTFTLEGANSSTEITIGPINVQVLFDVENKKMRMVSKYEDEYETSPGVGVDTMYVDDITVGLTTVDQSDDYDWSFTSNEDEALTWSYMFASDCNVIEQSEEGETSGETVDVDDFIHWNPDSSNYYISLRELSEMLGDDDDVEHPIDHTRSALRAFDDDPDNLPEEFDIIIWAKDGAIKDCSGL